MLTREKYDCQGCGRRIEKVWQKSRQVPVRIFEECGGCGGTLQTYMLTQSLFGVSQPEPAPKVTVTYELPEELYDMCQECFEEKATHWGVCAGCHWKREETRDGPA